MNPRRKTTVRSAQSFEEAHIRVKANAKLLDDKVKEEVVFPIIRKAFVTFLEITKKEDSKT